MSWLLASGMVVTVWNVVGRAPDVQGGEQGCVAECHRNMFGASIAKLAKSAHQAIAGQLQGLGLRGFVLLRNRLRTKLIYTELYEKKQRIPDI